MILALLLTAAQAEPEDDLGRGPLHMISLSPFKVLRAGFSPRPPSVLPEGVWEVRLTESWANLWAFNEDDILIDMEVLHTNLAVAVGLGGDVRADLELEVGARAGGGMDRLINNVHDFLGAETRHREDFSENDFQFELTGREGRPSARLGNGDRGFFSRALVGTLQWTFSRGGPGRPALSAAFSLRADLGSHDDLRKGSPLDVAVSLGGAERIGPLIFSVAGSLAWYGTERFQRIQLEPLQLAGQAAFEWPVHEDLSIILQYLVSQGAAEDWLEFSDPSHEIMLGARAGIGEHVQFEVGLLENIGIPNNSPDFGFHAGLAFRF